MMEEEYSPSDYRFPEAYVEGEESDKYMIVDIESRTYKLVEERPTGGIVLGRVVYEEAGEKAIDPVEAVVTRHLAILLPGEGRALLVKPGTRVLIYEVGGVQTVFTVREGDQLRPGKVMGYVLTGKGETRTVRSDEEVVVLYIAWDRVSHPPVYRLVAVPREDLVELREATV